MYEDDEAGAVDPVEELNEFVTGMFNDAELTTDALVPVPRLFAEADFKVGLVSSTTIAISVLDSDVAALLTLIVIATGSEDPTGSLAAVIP